jgi:reverse gyrase
MKPVDAYIKEKTSIERLLKTLGMHNILNNEKAVEEIIKRLEKDGLVNVDHRRRIRITRTIAKETRGYASDFSTYKGEEGRVISIESTGSVAVEFLASGTGRHDCDGRGQRGYCQYMELNDLEYI